jgi:hypothetical protein
MPSSTDVERSRAARVAAVAPSRADAASADRRREDVRPCGRSSIIARVTLGAASVGSTGALSSAIRCRGERVEGPEAVLRGLERVRRGIVPPSTSSPR